jgi:predicted transcriptional regulator YheO
MKDSGASDGCFLSHHIPTAEAIGALLYPHAEVVIHDLRTDEIFYFVNCFSHRKVGDPSLIKKTLEQPTPSKVIGPYEKANWNGELLKSVSAYLFDSDNEPIGLLCINLNTSKFEALRAMIDSLISPGKEENLDPLFGRDWREQINLMLNLFLKKKGKTLAALTRDEKVELIHQISSNGLFEARNAVSYVAGQLKVTRPTIYNYLRAGLNSENIETRKTRTSST